MGSNGTAQCTSPSFSVVTRAALAVVAASIALVLSARPAVAQVTTADIVGSAADASGGMLPGVTISIVNQDTSATLTFVTDGDGRFTAPLLPPGRYRVSFELEGFKTNVHEFALAIGDRFRLDSVLGVGAMSESLVVVAESPILQSQSGTVGALVGQKAMQDLPLNGRNFVRLAQVAPGVTEGAANSLSSGTRPVDRRQSSSIQVNGADTQANNFMIDGLDNNERYAGTMVVRPSVDAIGEMRVETSGFSAELGRTMGGIINVITKSGTNEFHGSAFEFYRHEKFDARNTFSVGDKPRYRQNQFGGVFGGPIIKGKTFFFGDYAGLRQKQGMTFVSSVPTAKMRAGDFSEVSAAIYDPFTGLPFAGNVIPANRIDPAAAKVIALYPLPQTGALSNNFSYSPDRTQDEDSFDIRLDHRFNDKNNAFIRYSANNTRTYFPDGLPAVNGVFPGGGGAVTTFPGPATQKPSSAQFSYNRILSSAFVFEAKAGYAHYDGKTQSINAGNNVADAMGIPGINFDNDSSGLPVMTITGYTTLGDAAFVPVINENKTYQGIANMVFTRGAHSVKAGFNYIHRDLFSAQSNFSRGNYAFNANFTSRAGAAGTGYGLASFLLGYPASVSRHKQLVQPTYLYDEYSPFVQYDWRVTQWLTVNAGLRYDYYTQPREKDNLISNVDLEAGLLYVAGQNGVSDALNAAPDRNNFGPRLSFAASVNPRTVVRGGYGIVYQPRMQQSEGSFRNPPFVSIYAVTPATFTPGIRLSDGLPALTPTSIANPTGAVAPIDPNITTNYAHQYNVAVQRELPGSMAVTVSFVGVKGRDLWYSLPVNTPLAGAGAVNARRPFIQVFPNVQTAFNYLTNAVSTDYTSVQALLEKRSPRGWGGRFQYTWSHATTTQPSTQQTYSQIPALANPFPEMLDYINYETFDSNQDVRHRATFSANYELGIAKNATGVLGAIAKGWQLNLVGVIQSGIPFTITNATARSNTGAADRPNETCDGTLSGDDRTRARWFDTSCYVAQATNTYGSVAANSLRGPGLMSWDFSIFKNFEPKPGYRLQARIEMFNVLNRANYANPASALGAANFGTISSTSGLPRNVQFGLKFLF